MFAGPRRRLPAIHLEVGNRKSAPYRKSMAQSPKSPSAAGVFLQDPRKKNVVRESPFLLCTTDIFETLKFARRYTAGSECATELLSTLGNAKAMASRSDGNPVPNTPRCFNRELLSDYGSRQEVSKPFTFASPERHGTDLTNRRSQWLRDTCRSRQQDPVGSTRTLPFLGWLPGERRQSALRSGPGILDLA